MHIGLLRPETVPLAIVEFFIVVIKVMTMKYLDICFKRPETLPLKIVKFIIVVIKVVMVVEVDLGLNRPSNILLLPITQMDLVYFRVSHFFLSC